MMNDRVKNKLYFGLRLTIYFSALAALLWLPWHFIAGGPVLCPFHRFFGLNCPGCGMTRAFWQLAHFHINQALRYNGFSLLFLPCCIFLICRDVYLGIKDLLEK
jgi:hypothetical protein